MIWCFLGLKAEFRENKIKISTELYRKGCVETAEEGLAAAIKIGFPVMIKASEGGGGKGIRKVESSEEFANFYRQVHISSYSSLSFYCAGRPTWSRAVRIRCVAGRIVTRGPDFVFLRLETINFDHFKVN